MPKIKIDGVEHEFTPGETVIQVSDRVKGNHIPRYCYHPGLTVVAQCRMCMVEIEKMPKLQTACSTPAGDGMVVYTGSEKVKAVQKSVMEFLLINHPLDCPICDKSGECDLQNYSYDYGAQDSRYEEYRRTYMDLDMGPVIKKNMNRCIHCTRCIRFCDEISGFREMIAVKRGNNTEITTQDGKALETEYAGNLADICPTGSLTLKDFRFKKRVWYLEKTPTVCEGCSQGCNLEVHHKEGTVYRSLPRENQEINKWWLCDEGRFHFHTVNDEERALNPAVQGSDTLWDNALEAAKTSLTGKVLVLVGTDLTVEEMQKVNAFVSSQFKDATVAHFGTPDVHSSKDDQSEDRLLKRTSKTANLNGAEKVGLKAWTGSGSYDSALVFSGGRAQIPAELKKAVKGQKVLCGVAKVTELADFSVYLPSVTWVEKEGTFVNWMGKEQKIKKAIDPRGDSRSIHDVVDAWA